MISVKYLQTRKSRVKNKGQKINFSVKCQIKTFLYILYVILYFQVERFQFVLMNRLIDSYRIYIKSDDGDEWRNVLDASKNFIKGYVFVDIMVMIYDLGET
jgi:hypothetical protein